MKNHPATTNTVLYEKQQRLVDAAHKRIDDCPGCTCNVVIINQGTPDFEIQVWDNRCPIHGN